MNTCASTPLSRACPIADITALYPIGVDGVLYYEIGAWQRIECRYYSHVTRLTRELSRGMTGTEAPILALYEQPTDGIGELMKYRLIPTVYSRPFVDAVARASSITIAAYVKVDTGLQRAGISAPDAVAFVYHVHKQ